MAILSDLNFWLVLGTWVLALSTILVSRATWRLVTTTQTAMKQQASDAKAATDRQSADVKIDLSVRLHMMMEEKWDGEAMAIQRSQLARQLLAKAAHDEIHEAVMDFFESLAILYRLDLVHKELAWNTFSFYGTRWWTACRDYIFAERHKQREDNEPMSFTEFEKFADKLIEREATARKKARSAIEPNADDIRQFLCEEALLCPQEAEPSRS